MSLPDRIWAAPTNVMGWDFARCSSRRGDKSHTAYLREDGPTITAWKAALRDSGLNPDSIALEAQKEASNG